MEEMNGDSGDSRDAILQRHKLELKEMKKEQQIIMHSFNKNNKKARKEANEKSKKLEADLLKKHQQELSDFNMEGESSKETKTLEDDMASFSMNVGGKSKKGKSKAQRRREKRAEMEEKQEREIAAQIEAQGPSEREIEMNKLNALLHPMDLKIKDIPADGNCLYSAVGDQLDLFVLNPTPFENSFTELRALTAQYMRDHLSDFQSFCLNVDGEVMDEPEYFDFCDRVEFSAEWGGHIELEALSSVLQHDIVVHKAEERRSVGTIFFVEKSRKLSENLLGQKGRLNLECCSTSLWTLLFYNQDGIKMDSDPDVFVPGQQVGESVTYSKGMGIYEMGGRFFATCVGYRDVEHKEGEKPILSIVAEKQVTSTVPAVGDVVTVRMTSIGPKSANAEILCVGSTPLKESPSAVIRIQDVRLHEIDKIEMYKCFRPGDLVRAEVVSLGDSKSYILSTSKNELGVVFAQSMAGEPMKPISWNEMICTKTGQKEYRKVAKNPS